MSAARNRIRREIDEAAAKYRAVVATGPDMLAALIAALGEIQKPGTWPLAAREEGVENITDYLARIIKQARAAGITTPALQTWNPYP